MSPHTISWTDRDTVIRNRPTTYEARPSGLMFAAPSQATGIASNSPASVASVAIKAVSIVGSTSSGSKR